MIAFSCTQDIVKSMGCVLVTPLVKEVIKKEKNPDNCQAAITHLTRVSISSSSCNMTFPPFYRRINVCLLSRLATQMNSCTACLN